jgi:hypothetical protein
MKGPLRVGSRDGLTGDPPCPVPRGWLSSPTALIERPWECHNGLGLQLTHPRAFKHSSRKPKFAALQAAPIQSAVVVVPTNYYK